MITILKLISHAVFASLVNTTLQMALLIPLVALIIWVFRIRSAATRYSLWLFAMLGTIALPLITLFVSQIQIEIPLSYHKEPISLRPGSHDSSGSNEVSPPAASSSTSTENATLSDASADDSSVADAPVNRELNISSANLVSAAYLIWAVGALATLCIVLDAYRRLGKLKMQSADVKEQTVLEILDRLRQRLKIRRSIALEVSPEVYSPISFGVLSPTIILPHGVVNDSDALEMVLTHELAHIKRWDYLINLFQNVLKVFLFFHPLFHLMNRCLAREREHICDDWVVEVTKQRGRYANCILSLLERASYQPVKALVITGIAQRKRDVPRRVDMIMDRTRTISTKCSGKALVVILVIGCLALIAIGSIVFIRRPTSDNKTAFNEIALGETTPAPEVQGLIDQVREEFRNYWTQGMRATHEKALQLAEKALSQAEKLPTERERKVARMHALLIKAVYLDYPERKKADRLFEESLALAREVGDRLIEARMLTHFASSSKYSVGYMSRTEILESRVKQLDKAASLYRSIGNQMEVGQTLLMKADLLMREDGQYAEAKQIITQVKEFLIESKHHSQEIVCDAALEFIEHIPQTQALKSSMDAWNWGCVVLKMEGDGSISYIGGPFGGNGGPLCVPLFYQIATVTDEPLIDVSKRPGDAWTKDTFSYGHHPLRTTVTVVSDGETVTVPAGTFTNCRLIRMATHDTDKTRAEEVRTNEALLGMREVWYAPGVGMVRLRVERENERLWKSFTLALKDYSIQQETQGYLPLAIGNRWVYKREDLDEQKYVSERVLQVRRRDEQNMYYLSHYGYVYQ